MLSRRAPLVALVVVLIGTGTTGCFAATPAPSPSTAAASPSPSPLFASDEEALAAATEAYAAYQVELDGSLATWVTSGLSEVATDPALSSAIDDVAEYESLGQRQSGSVTPEVVSLVSGSVDARDEGLQIYVCLNVSQVDVLDATGQSIVQSSRPIEYPIFASLRWIEESDRLVVADEEVWSGENFCA